MHVIACRSISQHFPSIAHHLADSTHSIDKPTSSSLSSPPFKATPNPKIPPSRPHPTFTHRSPHIPTLSTPAFLIRSSQVGSLLDDECLAVTVHLPIVHCWVIEPPGLHWARCCSSISHYTSNWSTAASRLGVFVSLPLPFNLTLSRIA